MSDDLIQAAVKEFQCKKQWGELRIVFRAGVPMNIVSTVDSQIRGPEQAAVASASGRKPNGPEYRTR
jgi:hypothetical protein